MTQLLDYGVTVESLVRLHIWENEQIARKLSESSRRSGHSIDSFVFVCDAANWHLSQASRPAFSYVKGIAEADQDHYPERLGQVFIVNAPRVMAGAWRASAAALSPPPTFPVAAR